MPRVNHFAIPADVPDRAINFYRDVFGWQFKVGWEYDTPRGREKYWRVITVDAPLLASTVGSLDVNTRVSAGAAINEASPSRA
jgi:predicted enzyme related to lactoylglutathione lyase